MIIKKPILDVLNGQKSDSIPVWLMRQAGRYLPEYRSVRSKTSGFWEMACNPDIAAQITLQPINRFNLDAAIIFSDILVIPYFLGQKVEFHEGVGPVLGDLPKNLSINSQNIDFVYESISQVRQNLPKDKALIGFAGAPWTLACYMLCGQGKDKDFMAARRFFWDSPDKAEKLINVLINAVSCHLIKQVQAGADVLQIFESWAGLASDMKWIVEPTRKIIENVKKAHPSVPIISFPKGIGQGIKEYGLVTNVDALSLDFSINTKWARDNLARNWPLQGNLDPACLLAGGKSLEREARRIIGDFKKAPFIFNLGHGVHKDTPPEHVKRLVEIVKTADL